MIPSHLDTIVQTLLWLETMCQRIDGRNSFQRLAVEKFTLSFFNYFYASPPPSKKKRRKKKRNTKFDTVFLNYRICSVRYYKTTSIFCRDNLNMFEEVRYKIFYDFYDSCYIAKKGFLQNTVN